MLARKGERILFTNDLAFNYFIGDESEQFSFIKVPKLFFTDARFEELSYGAKILYGLLLDRMGLSKKNKWLDKDKRVYVIYTIEAVTEDFKVSKTVAVRFMKELEDFGLIEKKRRPNEAALIYVKNFVLLNEGEAAVSDEISQIQGSPEDGSPKNGSPKYRNPEVQNMEVQNMEVQKTTQIQGSLNSGSPYNRNPEVQNMESNKTNIDDDELDILSSSNINREEDVINIIRDKINYKKIVESPNYGIDIVDEIISILADLCLRDRSLKIDGKEISPEDMRSKVFRNLCEDTFLQVIENITLHGADRIYNLTNYVLSCFYRFQTINISSGPKKKKGTNAFNDFKQHDYDFDMLEKALLKIR
jgi:hypothetical protein